MNMVDTAFCLYYLYPFSFAKFPQYFSYVLLDLSIYYLPAILCCKYDVVFAFPLGMV